MSRKCFLDSVTSIRCFSMKGSSLKVLVDLRNILHDALPVWSVCVHQLINVLNMRDRAVERERERGNRETEREKESVAKRERQRDGGRKRETERGSGVNIRHKSQVCTSLSLH